MLNILAVTFPFFALVLCGYLATRSGLLPKAAIPGLNTFVLYFAFPCMLYRFGSNTPLAQLLNPAIAGVFATSAVVIITGDMIVELMRRRDWNNAAFTALAVTFSNSAFMGVPLLLALLGEHRAAIPAIVAITVDLVFSSTIGIALSRVGSSGQHGVQRALKHALKGVAANPLPWAILLGGLSSGTGLTFSKPVMQTINLLADAASPTALFTIGAILARAQANAPIHHGLVAALPIALAKLILSPLIVFALGSGAIWLGVPLDRYSFTVMVLVAALPSASSVPMLAEKYGADSGRIAQITLASTALSFFTFSAAVALLT